MRHLLTLSLAFLFSCDATCQSQDEYEVKALNFLLNNIDSIATPNFESFKKNESNEIYFKLWNDVDSADFDSFIKVSPWVDYYDVFNNESLVKKGEIKGFTNNFKTNVKYDIHEVVSSQEFNQISKKHDLYFIIMKPYINGDFAYILVNLRNKNVIVQTLLLIKFDIINSKVDRVFSSFFET